MDGRMVDRWMDGWWTDGRMVGEWIEGLMGGWMDDGWMDGWEDGWMKNKGWSFSCLPGKAIHLFNSVNLYSVQLGIQHCARPTKHTDEGNKAPAHDNQSKVLGSMDSGAWLPGSKPSSSISYLCDWHISSTPPARGGGSVYVYHIGLSGD